MKTFKDLVFNQNTWNNGKHAHMYFDNKYGVSVLFGYGYSNGVDSYEVAILYDGHLCYSTKITNDVLPHQTKRQVTNVMKQIQSL